MRLIDNEGQQLGVVKLVDALRQAEEAVLDLVEIAPDAKPPVCRLMNYGKYLFEQNKQRNQAKKKQKQIQVKEVKFRPTTDEGDYQVKLKNLIRFLTENDKVKITVRYRGREMMHQELGMGLLKRLEQDLSAHGVVEAFPRMEGKQMVMVLGPKKAVPGQSGNRKQESEDR